MSTNTTPEKQKEKKRPSKRTPKTAPRKPSEDSMVPLTLKEQLQDALRERDEARHQAEAEHHRAEEAFASHNASITRMRNTAIESMRRNLDEALAHLHPGSTINRRRRDNTDDNDDILEQTLNDLNVNNNEGAGLSITPSTKEINKLVNEPISENDIRKILPNATIFLYSDLKNVTSLATYDYFFLLYELDGLVGHWQLLINFPGYIEVFGSYGYAPDAPLEYTNWKVLNSKGIYAPYFTQLLNESGRKVVTNTIDYQAKSPYVRTCGDFAIVRALMRHRNLDEFHKFIMDECKLRNCDPDDVVVDIVRVQMLGQ